MRSFGMILLVCIAVVAIGTDVSQADRKRTSNKNHPWYPNCTTNFRVCHDTACNFPGDPATSGKDECQADCLNELNKCLGPASRKRLETGTTGGNNTAGADDSRPKSQARPEASPPKAGVSPN